LLGTMIAAGAGATCVLSASVVPSHNAGCHPIRVPSNPQPADHRCCASAHASALTTGVFSPRPTLQTLKTDAIDLLQPARETDALPFVVAPGGGPPAITALRV
jgi:hypothetical protein